ncbi:MAG: hypothetical protein H6Q16_698 [Bacteroidetes bacterium]|nr:hypothetical protein [Bacteroidota bacterium]
MKKKSIYLTLLSIVFFFSCTEEDNIINSTGTFSTKDSFIVEQGVASAEMAISNIAHLIQLAIDEEVILNSSYSSYPIITKEKQNPLQTSEYPMTLTIDFGNDTIDCFDHRLRKGKIIANISAYWKDSLSVIDARTENYYMSTIVLADPNFSNLNFKTECNSNMKLKIKYEGLTNRYDNTYYPTQSITIDSAQVGTTLGNVLLSTQRYVFYKEGFSTNTFEDDKTLNLLFSSGEARDKKGKNWIFSSRNSESINDGLPYFAFNRACDWLISGDIKLYTKDLDTQFEHTNIINFGNSDQTSCDNLASYSYNGISIVISLP